MAKATPSPPPMPRMPWYPRDFAASTRTWPLIARAIYRELLDIQWDSGGLPNDPRTLQKLVHAHAKQWSMAWPYIEPKFVQGKDGLMRNPRLEQHRVKALKIYESRANSARAAAQARWGTEP